MIAYGFFFRVIFWDFEEFIVYIFAVIGFVGLLLGWDLYLVSVFSDLAH